MEHILKMDKSELGDYLDFKYKQYNSVSFIPNDPVSIPHCFSQKEDIEISGFFAAMLAWGQRTTIISKCTLLMEWMDNAPYEFVVNAPENDLNWLSGFKHRTFNGEDCEYFVRALRNIYLHHGGIGGYFEDSFRFHGDMRLVMKGFHDLFFSFSPPGRTKKHLANIGRGAAAKRLNMFVRWMVRHEGPIDFGIWKSIPAHALFMPLDLHTGNISRKLGLLTRKQDDWKAVEEITGRLRELDPQDPIKYDIPLFCLGAYKEL
jgi:uncharacterized protein (TIGR02757 family)